jgi:outer membrane protein TolC
MLANKQMNAIEFQTIWVIILLGLSGSICVEIAPAKSLDLAGIHQSLELSVSDRSQPQVIAQNTPSAANDHIKLRNDLNLPKTGADVLITNTKSLALTEAVEIAFRNNREVQAARLAVDRDLAGIRSAQAAQAVQLGLTSSLQTQGSSLIFGTKSTSSNSNVQGKLSATYTLLDAGLNTGNVRAAEAQSKFDKLDLIRVEQTVRGNVITAYYDLQAADSSVIIYQAAIRDAMRSLSDAQLQEKAGVGTKFDVLTAEVQLGSANQNLSTAQGTQQTARKNLAQLLVVDNNTEFTAADPVRELGHWGYSLEDSVVLAYKHRPEIQQKLVSRSISEQQQIVAAAADAPQVSLFGNYTLNKTLTDSSSAADSYSLGAQLSWSFWDGGAASANSDKQKVNQEIYENQFTTQRNQIRYEVEKAYYSLGSNNKNIATATQSLKKAAESLKLARLRFQAGVGTQTDVIKAQSDLATARGNRITAIINYNRALASLRTATLVTE